MSLTRLQADIAYQFSNLPLLQQALTHKSFAAQNNERLEFLGDAILNTVISDYLYQNFPEFSEGQLSRTRASLVKGEMLADIARRFLLADCLLLGTGELKSGGFKRQSILADALEALIGAVYLEAGFEVARNVILKIFDTSLNPAFLNSLEKDPKSKLQEYLQSHKIALPVYEVIKTTGEDHDQWFTVRCEVEALCIFSDAEGKTRRQAEQIAAEEVFRRVTSE